MVPPAPGGIELLPMLPLSRVCRFETHFPVAGDARTVVPSSVVSLAMSSM